MKNLLVPMVSTHHNHWAVPITEPQSNSLAERMVKTMKSLLGDTSNPHLALLSYRFALLPWFKYDPSELLTDRRMKNDIATSDSWLLNSTMTLPSFWQKDKICMVPLISNFTLAIAWLNVAVHVPCETCK